MFVVEIDFFFYFNVSLCLTCSPLTQVHFSPTSILSLRVYIVDSTGSIHLLAAFSLATLSASILRNDSLFCVIMWKYISDFYYPFFPFFADEHEHTHTQTMIINCWAHTADEPAKMFPSCVWWNPRAKITKNRRQNIRKLGKIVFGSFFAFVVFCSVYYPAERIKRAGTRGHDASERKGWLKKVSLSDCFAANLPSIYKLLSYTVWRRGTSTN